ncbi:hypothetical protein CA54_00710 [Symmachiella macrocystis]|uniref:Uncharacterized protein n=1 Tax=Symmachiella macrocystis TaxID=2527985 RepID=A0A5C6BIV1_9PLAN|nr:hypothetical protein CA54_00710 [Symmachiella macrocystis]
METLIDIFFLPPKESIQVICTRACWKIPERAVILPLCHGIHGMENSLSLFVVVSKAIACLDGEALEEQVVVVGAGGVVEDLALIQPVVELIADRG